MSYQVAGAIMTKPKNIPETVSRNEFNRILGNLTKSAPVPTKERRIGKIEKAGKIAPPTPKPER